MIDSNEHLTICNVNGRFMSFLLTSIQCNIVLSRVTVELTKSLQTQAIPQMPYYVVLSLFMTYRRK